MSIYFEQHQNISSFFSSDSWIVLSEIEQRIKSKIEAAGTPLKDWDINIYRGILTGYNDAFIIDETKKKKLISEDPKSAEIIRPLLRGRDIGRYSFEFADLFLLFIPWHFPLHENPNIKGASTEAEEQFKNQYPAVYNHLLQFKKELSNRNKAETGIRYEWYALQRWGANYWEDFFRPKIIFQEMVQKPSFILDNEGEYMCLDTARIISGKNLDILLAVLNSKLFFYAVKSFYGGGGLGDSGVRMKHTFFENFSMPIFSEETIKYIKKSITNFNNETSINIDNVIYRFYGLNNQEIEYVEAQ